MTRLVRAAITLAPLLLVGFGVSQAVSVPVALIVVGGLAWLDVSLVGSLTRSR